MDPQLYEKRIIQKPSQYCDFSAAKTVLDTIIHHTNYVKKNNFYYLIEKVFLKEPPVGLSPVRR